MDKFEKEQCYRKALELNPKLAVAWTGLGSTVTDKVEQVRCYRLAIEYDPGDATAWAGLGSVVTDKVEQERCYWKALELDPKNSNIWNKLGDIIADIEEKERCFSKVVELDPSNDLAKKKLEEVKQTLMVEHQRQEGSRLEKLKKIVKVSKTLLLDDLAKALGITRDDLLGRIFDWAAEFGFEVDGNQVTFGSGRKDDFIAALEREFETWSTGKGKRV